VQLAATRHWIITDATGRQAGKFRGEGVVGEQTGAYAPPASASNTPSGVPLPTASGFMNPAATRW